MEVKYYKEYSYNLGFEMEYKVYGHAGKPCIVFPAQNGRFFDYENFGMVDVLKDYLDDGLLQLYCVDSMDKYTWSLLDGDVDQRIDLHEKWFNYVCDEICQNIHIRNPYKGKIMTTGCSMGATHALNFLLRRPDLFDGVIALSGVYHASYFFPNYNNKKVYLNSIVDYMANIAFDHPYIDMYRQCKIIICIGQGRWEDDGMGDTRFLERRFKDLNVDAWVDYWGYDVDHDWPWWLKQIRYYMEYMLRD